MDTVILTTNDFRAIARHVGLNPLMDECIARLRAALQQFDANDTITPVRAGFEYTHPEVGLLEWMPIMQRGEKAVVKMVGYHPANPERRQLPTILSTVSAYDTKSGHLIGLADGTFLTALRTGAASAVASEVLAVPDAGVVGIIGCGAQGVSQLHALSRVFRLKRALIYDIDPAVSESFARRTAFLNIPVYPVPLPQLLLESDILCTATSVEVGKGPVFEDRGLPAHVHINAVGSDFPGKIEVPRSVLQRSLVCPDFPAQAVMEGECQQLSPGEIGPDLVEVVKNAAQYAPCRRQSTVFDSTGWALEDLVVLELLIDYATELGLGQRLALESISRDPHDPYQFIYEAEGLPPLEFTTAAPYKIRREL